MEHYVTNEFISSHNNGLEINFTPLAESQLRRLQTLLDRSPTGTELLQLSIELPVMPRMFDMANLMHDHIVDARRRGAHQFRIQVHAPVRMGTAPPFRHIE